MNTFSIKFINEVENISNKPDMYGIKTFSEFLAYLHGWLRGMDNDEYNKTLLKSFQEWLARKYKMPIAVHWTYILNQQMVKKDDPFGAVYKLLLQYQQEASRTSEEQPNGNSRTGQGDVC